MASGSGQWEDNGAVVSIRADNQSNHRIVSNGSGGAIIIWKDEGVLDEDIFAQEIRSDGTK